MIEAEISVVCAVGRHGRSVAAVHEEFRRILVETGRSAEFIYVLDGPRAEIEAELSQIHVDRFPIQVLRMAKGFGEATALQLGFERAAGRFVLTIPDRPQIDAATTKRVLEALDAGSPVVVTRRFPRSDALLNRVEAGIFHGLVRNLVGQDFHDMTCGLRGMTVDAARKLDLYGDQHLFIPVIATRCGFEVVELEGAQHADNRALRVHAPGVYVRRLLDILNIYFLARFTRKPLRFFGLIGFCVGTAGFLICAYLAATRLLFLAPLAGRPLLLLGVLLVVLGVQMASIGLLGEIIIFVSAKRESPAVKEIGDSDDVEELTPAVRR